MGLSSLLCSGSRIQAHPFRTGYYLAHANGLFYKGGPLKDMNGKL